MNFFYLILTKLLVENFQYSIATLSTNSLQTTTPLRICKSPSPPVYSSSESLISKGHYHRTPTLNKRFSPPLQNSPPQSSSDSSISSNLCSVTDRAPLVEDHHFSPKPLEKLASSVVFTNQFQVESKVVTKVDSRAQEGVMGVNNVEEGTGAAAGSNCQQLSP